jgi:hypothetical protein
MGNGFSSAYDESVSSKCQRPRTAALGFAAERPTGLRAPRFQGLPQLGEVCMTQTAQEERYGRDTSPCCFGG